VRLKSEDALLAIAQNGMLQRLDVSVCKAVSGRLLVELAASCARTLLELDISFCRGVQGPAVGHLLDSCRGLESLRVFGCSQLPRAALQGHSNARARIEGEPTYQVDTAAKLAAAMGAGRALRTAADGGAADDGRDAGRGSASSDSEAMEII
jgi:hypothetical protein